ncbi:MULTISPECIES: mechanosensitive ion channel domain-containing protein [Pseudomonas]|jgi:small-conductance mechanosensitive channel|uniref:Small-conductance mechanosensitive channel n=3 Tax=Pseudomonas fluorescens group TaxID=136843 RepID=A0AB36CXV8_9PSED|nr:MULTISPECIES: mechanosensitive ion channel domain-containing protein [Pseudomonas]MDF9882058.1 small-conductance mechanosensitive channel/CRP-like cAMP-binding protein [Pseudomonas silensiensis]AHZ68479.1 cyclic nucleotide-regulated small mechanosensitive ion channel [Pseudomonas mandelii JR-1]MBA4359765.1 mechanosensitive ion channel protein MscS [Pseudomonas sp.]MDI1329254.1 mechanosensitive ion channel [Pseudomonas sp.]MDO8403401.1 mechanosensitive ion channel [Pseudomonas sp.]
MLSLLTNHPLISALVLILIDLGLWRLISANGSNWKLVVRLVIFALFSVLLFNEGMNPLEPAPWADNVPLHLAATGLQIGWWLFGARTLTVLIGAVMMQRVGHTGRLLQDLLGAVIFLIAVIAALAYVLELPVKGVLATSGALAIIVGLALQSTLSDVFSGIVLNTTKPYQLDDWISIDGTEGRVTDIDWRATRLQTSQGSMVVIPNSLAAKAKIINFSRPSDMFGVSISLQLSPHARPQTVLDALERAMQGCRYLLSKPAPSVALKGSSASGVEYEISGFVVSMDQKRMVRNLLFDLAYRHLQASGVSLLSSVESNAPAVLSRPRALLDSSNIFSTLRQEEKDTFSQNMTLQTFRAGDMILPAGEVSDHLFIIESGVVSVQLSRGGVKFESGRMGPGEVIGEGGILSDTALPAEFSAKTACSLYRIEKDYLKPCLDARHDISEAMTALLDFRLHKAQALTQEVPKVVEKKGFLRWLRSRA